MRILLWAIGSLIGLVVILLLAMMSLSDVKPVVWDPAPNPGLTGDFAPNNHLSAATLLINGVGEGPEDVTRGPDGFFYTGFDDGRIVRFSNGEAGNHSVVQNTGGRPLGMQFDQQGNLIVADAFKGLLSISPDGDIAVLTDSVGGKKILFADDLDIAADGTVWFSDASQRFDQRHYIYDFLEASATGRLLSYSPATRETAVHLDNLFFANGVALGPDDQYVLVTETGTGRIHRLWLQGPEAGRTDLFFDALPGSPDNLSFNGTDTFWVAIPALRNPAIEALAAKPFIRKLLGALPPDALALEGQYGFVVGLDLDGQVTHNLHAPAGEVRVITSVNEWDGVLYLG
ncbi:MAG: SMP-30/gluconolactonase/LRE family protein, partial [Gammaproteobacteria bacterium]|nr:SMP-30/gluconolactonase/LRE family protein [Gammaproteobacteria bacterium]